MIRAKRNDFSYEEYVQMAKIINGYVLAEPLEEEELMVAIRQEEWDSLEISSEKTILLNKAKDVVEYWNCLWANGEIAFYNENEERYDTNDVILKGYLQEKYQSESITTTGMEEIMNQIRILLQNKKDYWRERSSEYILCGDELVSLLKDEVRPNTRTIYTDIYYPYKTMNKEEFEGFNGRAKSFMNEISCYDKDTLKVIWECIGCMLAPTKPFGKIFIWYGSGANGKSLLIKLVKMIMKDKMTHANILAINDKFALESIVKGLANVTDDVGITTLSETGILKTLIQGSDIEIKRKYKSSVGWKPNSQLVMCCNEIPKISDTSPGMLRRLAFVPFEMELNKEDIDIKLEEKIKNDTDNLRYILTGAIFAYREAMQRNSLTQTDKQKELIKEFEDENKSCIKLFYDFLLEQYGNNIEDELCVWLDNKSTEEIYDMYKEYRLNDKNIETQKAFSTNFRKMFKGKLFLTKHCLGGHSFSTYTLKKD